VFTVQLLCDYCVSIVVVLHYDCVRVILVLWNYCVSIVLVVCD